MNIYVSPAGDDRWSGRLPEPNTDGSDGPLATLRAARDAVRTLKSSALLREPVDVKLREGRYHVVEPLVFEPVDSGPIRYTSFEGERAVIDGGCRITGWQEATVGGVAAWVADLPDVAEGRWDFRQLFVNGERRNRPRLPREGFLRIADVPESSKSAPLFSEGRVFRSAPGDIRPWKNLTDVEVVVLHYWIEERSTIRAFDEATDTVTCERLFRMALKDEKDGWAKYYVENVFEELREPGDWYLDRPEGKLYYVPMPGETPESAEVYAPVAHQLLVLKGDPDAGRHVEFSPLRRAQFRAHDLAASDTRQGGVVTVGQPGARCCLYDRSAQLLHRKTARSRTSARMESSWETGASGTASSGTKLPIRAPEA